MIMSNNSLFLNCLPTFLLTLSNSLLYKVCKEREKKRGGRGRKKGKKKEKEKKREGDNDFRTLKIFRGLRPRTPPRVGGAAPPQTPPSSALRASEPGFPARPLKRVKNLPGQRPP